MPILSQRASSHEYIDSKMPQTFQVGKSIKHLFLQSALCKDENILLFCS